MKKYMLNILYGTGENATHTEDDEFIMAKYQEWSTKMSARTVVAHKLTDKVGRTLSVVKGVVTDGPYAETKESIGGFYIIEAESYDEAVEYAKDCPTLLYQGGTCEIREVEF